ncbi:unnamed protein product [Pleuronectes platessa]|uniref:Uncharacterized protein n=1 Tax=Pleuronectes platessa TaxID=8262 RepID=A0A9N7U0I5_PLEPL|nr:unnamed protein product [Pleuronectes platessa]
MVQNDAKRINAQSRAACCQDPGIHTERPRPNNLPVCVSGATEATWIQDHPASSQRRIAASHGQQLAISWRGENLKRENTEENNPDAEEENQKGEILSPEVATARPRFFIQARRSRCQAAAMHVVPRTRREQ